MKVRFLYSIRKVGEKRREIGILPYSPQSTIHGIMTPILGGKITFDRQLMMIIP
jgi:hypothetical protein